MQVCMFDQYASRRALITICRSGFRLIEMKLRANNILPRVPTWKCFFLGWKIQECAKKKKKERRKKKRKRDCDDALVPDWG